MKHSILFDVRVGDDDRRTVTVFVDAPTSDDAVEIFTRALTEVTRQWAADYQQGAPKAAPQLDGPPCTVDGPPCTTNGCTGVFLEYINRHTRRYYQRCSRCGLYSDAPKEAPKPIGSPCTVESCTGVATSTDPMSCSSLGVPTAVPQFELVGPICTIDGCTGVLITHMTLATGELYYRCSRCGLRKVTS